VSNYTHLIGTEDVRRAGQEMTAAASEMMRAASYIDDVLQRHQRFLDDWLMRKQATLEPKS
jgi:hypothetical protein